MSNFSFTALCALAAFLILAILALILGNVSYHGFGGLSWRFITGGTEQDLFDVGKAGIMPMIFGTAAKVIIITFFVMPFGVVTAIYLTEYARSNAVSTRIIRGAVNNLAGVPSIVFGLFAVGFFIHFVGQNIDDLFFSQNPSPVWGKEALIWSSLTLAVMTLPVVIVATEESLRAIPQGLREASLALGATKLQTIFKVVIPQALPGILTGAILAVSRAAGEVAPIMFTGATYFMATLPKSPVDQFMDLGFHVYILATQSPNIDMTKPIAFATIIVLLLLTFALNLLAMVIRAHLRIKMRATNH